MEEQPSILDNPQSEKPELLKLEFDTEDQVLSFLFSFECPASYQVLQ